MPYSRSYCVHFSFSNIFRVSLYTPCPTVCISYFSHFSVFLAIIFCPTVCVSHFPWFLVFSPYTGSYSVHFSFFIFFRGFPHISLPNVCVSHFPWFSVFLPYARSFSVYFSFTMIFSFLSIFQVQHCSFLIFHVFQFFLDILCPTVCFAHF